MSELTFTLHVPSEAPYRTLASDVVTRYLAGLGADAARCAACDRQLADAMAELARGAGTLDLTIRRTDATVDVTISAGGRDAHVRQSLV